MQPLNLMQTELSGTHLIEAGAGTGKTYTITGLFLRLILEKKMSVDQILVVTYTKAATEELRARIRRTLIESKKALLSNASRDDVIGRIIKKVEDPLEAAERLQDGLRDFDGAAIFTIHGFCQRLLYEHAFETGELFDTELITDQTSIVMSIAEDFWRRRIYDAATELVAFALGKNFDPSYFYFLIQKSRHPELNVVPASERPALSHLELFRSMLDSIKGMWNECRHEVRTLLKNSALSGVIYGGVKQKDQESPRTTRDIRVEQMMQDMDRFTSANSIGIPLCASFEKFTAGKIMKSTRKGEKAISHPFFDQCEALQRVFNKLEGEMNAHLLYLRSECLSYAKRELNLRKRKFNVQFFDDLLMQVFRALENKNGKVLASGIRSRYRAALVDEFQDTDMLQFEIFSKVFSHKDSTLFMIGDPKQSIYSFRGADIFSYMKASSSAENRHTLLTNYRSEPGLIQAVNTIFSAVKKPFVFEEIIFNEGKSFKENSPQSPNEEAPMKLWWVPAQDEEKPVTVEEAVQQIARSVAGEILRRITDRKHRIPPGDIAVLVRTNKQAEIIKSRLMDLRIPSVLHSAGNVFDTHEALELERILKGIAAPRNSGLLKAALATAVLGGDAEMLDSENADSQWWEGVKENFRVYRQTWSTSGFMRMFSLFLGKEKVRSRLLSLADGERRLTNLLHLSEILHATAMEKGLAVEGLLKWFAVQRDPRSPRLEAHQLRLESDSDAVKIITIHKSKGLEYPVVFCPYAWGGSSIRDKEIIFHGGTAERSLTLDLGSPEFERHRNLAQIELLAENLRLLYVALTRAKKICYLIWGRIGTTDTSAMAYLFHGAITAGHDETLHGSSGSTRANFLKIPSAEVWADLKKLESRSRGTIQVMPMPLAGREESYFQKTQKDPSPVMRVFSGNIDKSWRISSYTSLVSNRTPHNEMPDHDDLALRYDAPSNPPLAEAGEGKPAEMDDAKDQTSIAFPKGAAAGIFFHDVFEHLDFSLGDTAVHGAVVKEKLKTHGFELSWQDTVMKMIEELRSVSLDSARSDFTLSAIAPNRRISEVAFFFPLHKISPQKLKRVFDDNSEQTLLRGFPEQLDRLVFSPTRGFMKGYIDMLFEFDHRYYLLDWKSNFLGPVIEDYKRDKLEGEMIASFYTLQYLIYTLATHNFLKMRRPDYDYVHDFGGVFYLFIRGVKANLGPEFGIFAHCPSKRLIDALGKALIPGYDAQGGTVF